MIIGMFGNLGTGKTIMMVLFAYIRMVLGSKVYSNFRMKGTDNIDKITDLLGLKDCVILIDDIIPWLDARQSMSNTFITQLMMLGRKSDVHLLYTSQYEQGQDIRLRVITNVCNYPYLIEFPYFGNDMWIGFRDNPYSELLYEDMIIRYEPEVYDLYDTYEVAYQKITMSELVELYNELAMEKNLFVLILNIRYNIMKVIGEQIFVVLKNRMYQYLPEIMLRSGYKMEEDLLLTPVR